MGEQVSVQARELPILRNRLLKKDHPIWTCTDEGVLQVRLQLCLNSDFKLRRPMHFRLHHDGMCLDAKKYLKAVIGQ